MVHKTDANPAWVRIAWPPSMPRTLEASAKDIGWRVRRKSNAAFICLEERYLRQPVVAMRLHRLGGRIGDEPLQLSQLAQRTQRDTADWASKDRLRAEIARNTSSSELADRLWAFRCIFTVAPSEELPHLVNTFLLEHLPELHGGTAQLLQVDAALYHGQVIAASLLVRAAHDPGLMARARNDDDALMGGAGLDSQNLLGGALFLYPAMTALGPLQLGCVASRQTGSLVALYPEPIGGSAELRPRTIARMMQPWYFTKVRTEPITTEPLTGSDNEQFLSWWVGQWNRLLAELLDPATHRTSQGDFDPSCMLGRFVTLERLLNCVQGILMETGLNDFVRMALFFDAMDLCEGLGGGLGGWDRLTAPSRALKDLEAIREELHGNDSVSRVVLPRCERAVRALVSLGDTLCDTDTARPVPTSSDARVSALLHALRNAGHGLRGDPRSSRHLATLVSHESAVPPDLPDLAWFHLVRLLCFGRWRQASA